MVILASEPDTMLNILTSFMDGPRTEVGTELAESLASHGAFSRCILCTCFFLLVTMADKNALVKVLDRL